MNIRCMQILYRAFDLLKTDVQILHVSEIGQLQPYLDTRK
jgi:hypothetical protein